MVWSYQVSGCLSGCNQLHDFPTISHSNDTVYHLIAITILIAITSAWYSKLQSNGIVNCYWSWGETFDSSMGGGLPLPGWLGLVKVWIENEYGEETQREKLCATTCDVESLALSYSTQS